MLQHARGHGRSTGSVKYRPPFPWVEAARERGGWEQGRRTPEAPPAQAAERRAERSRRPH